MKLYLLVVLLLTSSLGKEPKLPKHVVPLYGNVSLGYYYANFYVGNPPQEQSVIVDTGSGQMAFPCSKCEQCGPSHINPPFKLSDSQTSKILTCISSEQVCRNQCDSKRDSDACTFSISYAEGSSLSGIIIEDEIQFEGSSEGESIKTTFGCTTKQTNLFYSQAANGIFGLAPYRQSKLFQKLYAKHSPTTGEKLLFSLCLAKNGGQFIIGESRPQIHLSPQSIKTTFNASRNLYSLDGVGQMRIGRKVIKSKNESTGTFGVFIDSGSTFTYLPQKNYNALLVALENACSWYPKLCLIAKSRNNCFKIQTQSKSTIQQTIVKIFPSFDIQINKKVVKWSPADYFILTSLQKKQVCLGIDGLDRFLLGGNWMVNRDIAFNLKQGTVQIFSNSRCQLQKETSKQPAIQLQNPQKSTQIRKPQQTTYDQMPEYSGELRQQQLSYIDAIFRQDNTFTETLIILICIVGFILVAFMTLTKYFCKKASTENPKNEGVSVALSSQSDLEIKTDNQAKNDVLQKEVNMLELHNQGTPQGKQDQ